MSVPPTLVLENVTVQWQPGAAPVLQGVSFALAPGERAALVGLNGAGKTTLLLALVGMLPFTGEIQVAGVALSPASAAALRRQAGFLFNIPEDQLLFPDPLEDVALALLQRGVGREEAFRRAAERLVTLGAGAVVGKPLAELSHGQKQRVALAGALIADPPVLLLDEPAAALDPPGRRELAQLLSSLPAAMLMATHDLDFAGQVCGRFLLLEGGRLSYDGPDPVEPLRRWGMAGPQVGK